MHSGINLLLNRKLEGELGELLISCINNISDRDSVISTILNYPLERAHIKDSDLISMALLMLNRLNGGSYEYYAKLYYIYKEKDMECAITVCNIILKRLIDKKMYKEAREYISNGYKDGNYNYYRGIVQCVSAEYEEALKSFKFSRILSKRKTNNYEVITLMLISDIFTLKNYNWMEVKKPYKELFENIKLGEIEELEKTIQKNYSLFYKDNTLILINRLFKNIIQEGIRKISMVYRNISIKDINDMLKIDVEPLLKKTIEQGIVNGRIENGCFLSSEKRKEEIRLRTNETYIINSKIEKLMVCKEKKDICYENMVENKFY